MTPVPPACRGTSRTGALDELTLTTNGSQLARYAGELAAHGVERINVSLDTLDPDKFRAHHPLGRSRQGDGGHRRRAGGRACRSRSTPWR